MPNLPFQKVKSFFYGQYFSDGIKITVGVLLPSLLLSWLNQLEMGLTISLGALCVSIPDNTGPVIHRRNSMLLTIGFIFITALFTGLVNQHIYLLAVEIFIFCFFFGMFNVYGQRTASIGSSALLVMILTIDLQPTYFTILHYSLLIMAGGFWYLILSLFISGISPYRAAKQALGECVIEVAKYLEIKSEFYGNTISVDENYNNLVFQQIEVSQRQESVREIVFETRKRTQESTRSSRLVVMILVDIVDLFDQAMKTHYDYSIIRETYKNHHVLNVIRHIISSLATELYSLGHALIANENPELEYHFENDLEKLRKMLEKLEEKHIQVMALKKIYINLRNISFRLGNIFNYFNENKETFLSEYKEIDYSKFVSHQEYGAHIFWNNLSLKSNVFRHALRLAITCLAGFVISQSLPFGQHSYWILLTVLVILKPGFSLTRQRNNARVIGTIVGGLAGILILYLIQEKTVLFLILLVFMVLTYTFQRVKYIISVLFMTPFILILFRLVSPFNDLVLAKERIIDTLIGSGIALASIYLVFPTWESFKLKSTMSKMLIANLSYLQKISNMLLNKPVSPVEYKLARKEVYIKSANLAGAFQRMLTEPKSKQKDPEDIHQFVVLNHILSSYLATLSAHGQRYQVFIQNDNHLKILRKIFIHLEESIRTIEKDAPTITYELPTLYELKDIILKEEAFIKEQLEVISKISADIEKICKKIV